MMSPLETPIAFHIGPLPVAWAVLVTWGIMAFLVLGARAITRNMSMEAPSTAQSVLEMVVEVLDGQIRDTMQADPAPYRALIGTIFVFVLTANWISLIPGIEAPTAHLEVDAALALIVFVAIGAYGIRAGGVRGFLHSFAAPTLVMIPLNLVEAVTRIFSLMIRLLGNIMSGAFVIAILLSLSGLLVPIPFMALDMLTGAIQAYIFAILAMVFISSTVAESRPESQPGSQPDGQPATGPASGPGSSAATAPTAPSPAPRPDTAPDTAT